jgi:probable H4MPT-linked C1 transfer pathway protein
VLRSVLGLDIGGANLKAAHSNGAACLRPFDLWKDPAGLSGALRDLLRDMPTADLLAVTMTGELCDCFVSKREGVHAILEAVEAGAGPTPVRVWSTAGKFVSVNVARSEPLHVAAGNWHALATFAGRFAPDGPALLIDVGSTTTDIIPLRDGRPVPLGRTDPERLRTGELVYTGVRRTPLCALLDGIGAAEFFATALDVYLVLGMLPDDPSDRRTADGRPATRDAAHARLARMLCADLETSTKEERLALAARIHERQLRLLREAVGKVAALPRTVILSGSGEFLAQELVPPGSLIVSLGERLGPDRSQAACAYALAVLATGLNHHG